MNNEFITNFLILFKLDNYKNVIQKRVVFYEEQVEFVEAMK